MRYCFDMDWKQVIADIKARWGLTQPQMASFVGCAQVTISDLATGRTTEPRWSLGQSLIVLRDTGVAQAPASQALAATENVAVEVAHA